MDPTERKDFGTKSEDDLAEYERVGVLVARKNDLFSAAARKGYEEHGRGAVFYCEVWEETLPKATPGTCSARSPSLLSVGTEIQRAVAVYRPLSEGVVVISEASPDTMRSLWRGCGCQPTIPPSEPG